MRFKACLAIVSISLCIHTATGEQQGPVERNAFGDSEFKLGPDDKIQVFVWKEPELSTTVVVRPDGKVSLPLIGELTASGRTAAQLQGDVTVKLRQYVSNPTVNVIVQEVNSAKVSVLGEVKTPGQYLIRNSATILDAIASAGGFTEYAKRDKVTIIRNTPTGEATRINLNVEQLIKKAKGDMFYVQPYDKIYVQ